MIKDGVAYDPNEVANTKSSFIRDLCFSLSKQELNFVYLMQVFVMQTLDYFY
jgi:hypothetical protein